MASIAFPSLAKKAKLSDGTTYGYVYVPAAPGKPTFLLLHGAPSSCYIWHHQIEHLPRAGFGVLAPDLLGYGDTDRPAEVEPYQLKHICPQVHDLVANVVGLDKVIGVGHDWGSLALSGVYMRYKDLFSALVFIAVGYSPFDQDFDLDTMNRMTKEILGYSTSGYIHLFVSPEGASLVEKNDQAFDSLLYAKDPEAWKEHLGAEGGLKKFLDSGEVLPVADWISPEELQMHNRILKNAYDGVFNWYKAGMLLGASEEDKQRTAEGKKILVPTLLLVAEKDYAIVPDFQIQMTQASATDLRVERFQTSHWIMLEERDAVEKLLEQVGDAN